jgi:hypothetical protein
VSTTWKRQAGKLDPDVPDKFGYTLRSRTEKAEGPINVYMEEDYEQAMVDLLTDLMHLADREGEDFDTLVRKARSHYLAEINDEL